MRKGQRMSQEQKDKLSKSHKGRVFSEEHKRKLSESHKGKIPCNLEQLQNLRKGKPLSEEHRKKLSESQIGKIVSEDSRKKMSESRIGKKPWNKGLTGYNAGENNPRWIKDRSILKNRKRRMDSEYQRWRRHVRRRDKNECRLKDENCDGGLETHHILSYKEHEELRYVVDNGICLCHYHHPRKKKDCEILVETLRKIIAN